MPSPSTDREALIAILAEQAQSGGAHQGPEPEPEELLDYLEGRLAPEAAQRLERKLVASPGAARALLDVAELEVAGAAAGQRPAEIPVLAGWRELKGRLPGTSSWFQRPMKRFLPIAASLLLPTVFFGVWISRLQSENRATHRELKNLQSEQEGPIVNIPHLNLRPLSRAEKKISKASAGLLSVEIAPGKDCPTYTIELKGPQGNELQPFRSEDIQRFDVSMPADGELLTLQQHFEPGLYNLRLLGCEPGHLVSEYRFKVLEAHVP